MRNNWRYNNIIEEQKQIRHFLSKNVVKTNCRDDYLHTSSSSALVMKTQSCDIATLDKNNVLNGSHFLRANIYSFVKGSSYSVKQIFSSMKRRFRFFLFAVISQFWSVLSYVKPEKVKHILIFNGKIWSERSFTPDTFFFSQLDICLVHSRVKKFFVSYV